MHPFLTVERKDLEGKADDWDFLSVLIDKYYALWSAEPERMVENFNDDQHALLAYNVLYGEVMNGGFIQLMVNGHGDYVFNSPFTAVLRQWGAICLADLLEEIKPVCLKAKDNLEAIGGSLEKFSEAYDDYPEFDGFDSVFDEENNLIEIRVYVEDNLEKFIQIK